MRKEDLESKMTTLPCWRGPVSFEPLKGGLTNLSYVVTDGAEKFVVRFGADIPVHHVSRERERAASIAAFAAGLSPEIIHGEAGIMVMRFIAGRTFVEADMRANVGRLAALMKDSHAKVGRFVRGPAGAFWVFHVIRDYVHLLGADRRYIDWADRLEQIQVPLPIVFGHHDLLPGNLMDDGTRLWLIDWEYGAFGTALFDLANLSANGDFGPAEDAALLDGYFGAADAPLRRAFAAMKAASALREALWAMVSDVHLRTEGVDYQAHARTYLARFDAAKAALDLG